MSVQNKNTADSRVREAGAEQGLTPRHHNLAHNPRPMTRGQKGQSIIEFTYAVGVMFALIGGMVLVFRWAMMDLSERRFDHEHILTMNALTTEDQLTPGFHKVRRMDAMLFKE